MMNFIHNFARECDGNTHQKINSVEDGKSRASHPRYSFYQTRRCFFLTLILVAAISFSVGTLARIMSLYKMGMLPQTMRNREMATGETVYFYEALVHPAMITHPRSKRVAIIGDAVCSILHEVMKHNTIEYVVIAELDDTGKNCLTEWSQDSRVQPEHISNFLEPVDVLESDKFDVLIVNTFNEDKMNEIISELQRETSWLSDMLSDDGVFATELNGLSTIEKYSSQTSQELDMTDAMVLTLQTTGFQSIHVYEGPSPRNSFVVALKDYDARSRWYLNTAETTVELRRRLHRTKSGDSTLTYLDSTTLFNLQVPSKAQETRYCQRNEEPWECAEYKGMSPDIVNIPISHLEARKSEQGEFAGRGLFAAQDIEEGSTFDVRSEVKSFEVFPSTWFVIENFLQWAGDKSVHIFASEKLASLEAFIEGYGYRATVLGKKHFTVDSGITTFCNHGCNGTFNVGDDEDYDEDEVRITELNADLNCAPVDLMNKAPKYSPVVERHLRQVLSVGDVTLRDIKKGEEILCDYLAFVGDPVDWKDEVLSLRGQCSGQTFGDITAYEVKPEHDPA